MRVCAVINELGVAVDVGSATFWEPLQSYCRRSSCSSVGERYTVRNLPLMQVVGCFRVKLVLLCGVLSSCEA
jgi:hypothetical protein